MLAKTAKSVTTFMRLPTPSTYTFVGSRSYILYIRRDAGTRASLFARVIMMKFDDVTEALLLLLHVQGYISTCALFLSRRHRRRCRRGLFAHRTPWAVRARDNGARRRNKRRFIAPRASLRKGSFCVRVRASEGNCRERTKHQRNARRRSI